MNASPTSRAEGVANTVAHHEPGMIVDAGQQLALAPIGESQPTDNVELPKMHRRLTLPALVLPLVQLGLRVD